MIRRRKSKLQSPKIAFPLVKREKLVLKGSLPKCILKRPKVTIRNYSRIWKELGEEMNIIKIYLNLKLVLNNRNRTKKNCNLLAVQSIRGENALH